MENRPQKIFSLIRSPHALGLLGFFVIALIYEALTPEIRHNLPNTLCTPNLRHPLGCDAFGRDLLALTLHSALQSSMFAVGAVSISCVAGTILGASLSLMPRSMRFLGLRLLDFFLAFPSLLIALTWAALRGPGWDTLVISLMIGTFPPFIRLIEVQASEILKQDYVTASRTLGAHPYQILIRHQIPALLNINGIKIPHLFAHALLAEATLSFLGVGAPIGADTWGSLLNQGREYLMEAPHIGFGSGISLFLTVYSLLKLSEKLGRIR